MLKAIIVDDEPLALDVLETFIEQMPGVELIARCGNAFEANEALKNPEINLMFLDIQMPQMTGLEFLKSLAQPPMVIFTTAYSEYAVEGFELDIVDYLLKPISVDRFMKAVNKASEKLGTNSDVASSDGENFIFVKADKKLIKVNFDDIKYIEGLKDYVIIKKDQGRIITLQTMKSLEEKLPSSQFMRIHRSYILNIGHIKAIVGNMVEIMEKGQIKHIPIGKNYRESLLAVVNSNRL